jgi:hypothetical protein
VRESTSVKLDGQILVKSACFELHENYSSLRIGLICKSTT